MSTGLALGWVLVAYLLGTLSWSYWLVKRLRQGMDLRSWGSGNLGATNAGRLLGKRWAVIIYLLDLTKGLIAVGLPVFCWSGAKLFGVPLDIPAGLAVMLGHIFPFYLGFKGGKGVATGSGVIFAMHPITGALALLTWALLLLIGRIVSAASILAALAMPVFYYFLGDSSSEAFAWRLGFFTAAGLLVAVMHKSNIKRILSGEEERIGKAS